MSDAYRYGRAEQDGERLPWWCVYDASTGDQLVSGLSEQSAIAQCGLLNSAYAAGHAAGRGEVEGLVKALEFYANKDNYYRQCACKLDPRMHAPDEPCTYGDHKVDDDFGDMATAALSAHKKGAGDGN